MFIKLFSGRRIRSKEQTIQTLLLSAKFIVVALAMTAYHQAYAHEFWIQPEQSSISVGDSVVANLLVGQDLKGETQAFITNNFRQFTLYQQDKSYKVNSRLGDIPALNQTVKNEGLLGIKYESHRSITDYESWEKFVTFLNENGLEDVAEDHKARQLAEQGFKETFIRYSKSLLKVGTGVGEDIYTGMPFEWVVNTNPYTDEGDIHMTLLADGEAYAGAVAHIFVKEETEINKFTLTTDDNGLIRLPRTPGFFLVNAVKMDIPPKNIQKSTGAVWESAWASHTFYINAP